MELSRWAPHRGAQMPEFSETELRLEEAEKRLKFLNVPLRFSKLCHAFHQNGTTALYNPLRQEAVFINQDLYDLLKPLHTLTMPMELMADKKNTHLVNALMHLKGKDLLIESGVNEFAPLEEVRQKYLGRPSIGILYLLLSDQCNFKCSYCFIENTMPNDYKFSMMSKETARNGLDLFANCLKRNPEDIIPDKATVLFYGGEPLLNPKTLKFALEYIDSLQQKKRLPQELEKTLITNGSLITQSIVKVIKEHRVGISISLDGWKTLNDQNRRSIGDKGTFDLTMKGCQILESMNIPFGISCTITNANLNSLTEIFKWFIERFKIQGMGFNLLVDLPHARLTNKEYVEKATDKLIECFQLARECGVYEDRITRRVEPFVKGYIHFKDCGGCGNQLVVSPDGKVGVCQAYLSSSKNFVAEALADFDPFADSVFIEWSKRSPLNIPECIKCEALGICGGFCAYNTELQHGNIWAIDDRFCVHSRKLIKWLIWDLYERLNPKYHKGGEEKWQSLSKQQETQNLK